jgi:hypothetical protein
MEGMPIMQVRRRWSPVAEMPTDNRTGALATGQRWSAGAGVRNIRYDSSRALRDIDEAAPWFVPNASIEGWRERIRRDARLRDALLNPRDYEPH